MIFNSIEFSIFLPIVFFLYWFATNKSIKLQNLLLLFSSYFFYAWWDWRFLLLIVFSSTIDYIIGLKLLSASNKSKRKLLLLTSIFINIGFLGFFKYFNFFSESFSQAFTLLGSSFQTSRLDIILPVGISFYTFQTLSYSIDVYKRKIAPTKDCIAFFSFVSFFPQLVAGPIERAVNLLPQFNQKRNFDYFKAVDGLKQILWGLFKKVVIADNCAIIVNDIFANYASYSSSTLILGAIFFAFQIYGDFSGYSDIAIGTSRLFGFQLMQNFAFPYFSRDIAEFWRRWHISLSTWFRDYLYIPLGGSRGSTNKKVRNIFIIFIVSGFWHGANWTFIIWGILNAFYFLPLLLFKTNRDNLNIAAEGKLLPTIREVLSIFSTFSLTVFAWIFFRAEDINHAISYISKIFSNSLFSIPAIFPKKIILLILIFVFIEWLGREGKYGIEKLFLFCKRSVRWLAYIILVALILYYSGKEQPFLYFQF